MFLPCTPLLGVAMTPNSGPVTTYTLFLSYFEESQASMARMDGEGNIQHVRDYPVGYDAQWVSVSPNGQAVAVSTDTNEPSLSTFFPSWS